MAPALTLASLGVLITALVTGAAAGRLLGRPSLEGLLHSGVLILVSAPAAP